MQSRLFLGSPKEGFYSRALGQKTNSGFLLHSKSTPVHVVLTAKHGELLPVFADQQWSKGMHLVVSFVRKLILGWLERASKRTTLAGCFFDTRVYVLDVSSTDKHRAAPAICALAARKNAAPIASLSFFSAASLT